MDKKLLELISNYSKVAEYKVNVQKSTAFQYTNSEQEKLEIKNTIPFTLISPKKKYLGINLTKYIQNLYEENYKTLMTEIKELEKIERYS